MGWALNLNANQKTRIQAIQDKARTDMQAMRQPDASGQRPDRATIAPKIQALNDQTKKAVEAVLTAGQRKQEASVVKQAGIYNRAGIPLAVVPTIKLTSAQSARLDGIETQSATEQQAVVQKLQAEIQKLQAQMEASRKTTHDKAMAVLTGSQKAAIEKYQAAHPRPQRGGGRGPGAGSTASRS
jgi:precorrin-4 methylase